MVKKLCIWWGRKEDGARKQGGEEKVVGARKGGRSRKGNGGEKMWERKELFSGLGRKRGGRIKGG